MAALSQTLPVDVGYVATVALTSTVLNFYLGLRTAHYRRRAGVKYPTAYASDELVAKSLEAYQFNCAQRAHANFTENYTAFLTAMGIAAVDAPRAAAAWGAVFLVGRLVSAMGYSRAQRDGGKGRYPGFLASQVASLGLLWLGGRAVWRMVGM